MTRLLVVDGIRRLSYRYGGFGIIAAGLGGAMAHVPALGGGMVMLAAPLSMALAFGLGPWSAIGIYNQREVYALPVPRRAFWRAQWLLGAMLAPLWLGVMKLAGAALAARAPAVELGTILQPLALSTLLDAAYCGAFFVLLAGTPSILRLPVPAPVRRVTASALSRLTLIVLTGGVAWPFVLMALGALPRTWDAGQGVSLAVLAGACVLSLVAGVGHHPGRTPRGETRNRAAAATSVAPGRRPLAPFRSDAGPTGMRMLMLRELGIAVACAIAVIGAFSVPVWALFGLPGLTAGLQDALTRFEQEGLPYLHGGIIALVGMPFGWFIWWSGRNGAVPLLRPLRTLPLSRRRLAGYILMISAFFWVSTVGLLIALVIALTGKVPAVRADLLILVGGMIALGHALNVTRGRAFWFGPPIMMFVFGIVAMVLRSVPHPVSQLSTPLALGVTGLVAAALLIYALLGRSSTYRPAARGFTHRRAD